MKKLYMILPLALILCFMVGCQDKEAMAELKKFKAQAALEEQNKEVVRRYWNGKWNERRAEILDELQTPDVVYHGYPYQMNGIEEYKQVYSVFASALHDTRLTIEELIAEGDKVMTRVTTSGIHKGELMGILPTGNNVTWTQFTVFRLVDGKIAEEWEVLNELGMMQQLGMELKPKEGEK
jgi:predicted ester cyclase